MYFCEAIPTETMRYFTVLFFILYSFLTYSQEKNIKGVLFNESGYALVQDADVLNLSNLKITSSAADGYFSILAKINDTLHISTDGFRTLKIQVTPEWFNNGEQRVYLSDTSTVLDEMVINTLKLTGILAVDTKLIALADYPYYRDFSSTGFSVAYTRGLNPISGIYNAIKHKDQAKVSAIKQEVELIERMKTRYDREMASALLNINKEDIIKVLQRCNHSERFIYTANDYQIFNAVNECYADYKLVN